MLKKLVITKSKALLALTAPADELPIEALHIYENSKLVTIPPKCFEKFPKLKSLKLSGNAIMVIPAGVLKDKNQVKHVELQRNKLKAIPLDLLKVLPKGAGVILWYNVGITNVTTEDISTMVQRKLRVTLDHLFIVCNCDFKILAMLNKFGVNYGIYGTCAFPSELSRKRFSELVTEDFKECPAEQFLWWFATGLIW
ncbi:Uncharacterised protein g3464 [Pycnogonum litorale]